MHQKIPPLAFATNDAKSVAAALEAQCEGAIVRCITDEKATRDGALEALAQVKEKITAHDTLFIYFAGHSYGDKDDHNKPMWGMALHDSRPPPLLKTTSLTGNDLKDLLDGMNVRNIVVFLDTAHTQWLFESFDARTLLPSLRIPRRKTR